MKRIRLLISCVLIFVLLATNSVGQGLLLFYDGSDHDVTGKICSVRVNGSDVATDVPAVVLYDKYPMVPLRAVFNALGADISWNGNTKSTVVRLDSWTIELKQDESRFLINGTAHMLETSVKAVSIGNCGRTMVPLSLFSIYLKMNTVFSNETKSITIDRAGAVSASKVAVVASPKPSPTPDLSIKPGSAVNQSPSPAGMPTESPKQVHTATPKKSPSATPAKTPPAGASPGTSLQPGQSSMPEASPTPLPTATSTPSPTAAPTSSLTAAPTVPPGTAPTVSPTAAPTATPKASPSVSPSAPPSVTGSISDIFYYNYGGKEQIVIMTKKVGKFSVSRQADPNALILDFTGTATQVTGSKTTNVKGSIVEKYGLEQLNSTTARVTIDVSGLPGYEASVQSDRIILFIEASNLKNITYTSINDRTCFNLAGAKLTQGDQYMKKLYRDEYSQDGTAYIIAFPSNLANLNNGIVKIDDKYLNNVEISNDTATGITTIFFYAKMRLDYNIIYRPETNDTAITILKPYALSDRLVVIDPGHGGYDPGAVSGSVYEKNLNLDIAVKLARLLREKNISTYVMREDDSFVGLYERAYIANSLNASLFLCIHNNALGDPYFLGTMTLYTDQNPYDKDLFGRKFAQIIQDNLTARLKSVDRNIRRDPGLVVLKATQMPSALAEVGFMTNSYELSNLLRDNYRLAAAQALRESVIEALGDIK